jgi:branched-chain amino acid transport system substrate-binding protein
LLAALLAIILSGCSGSDDEDTRVRGDTLVVYASAPGHGVSSAAGDAALAGARRALGDAGGRAGGRRVELVRLSANEPGDAVWDPATIEAGAKRAADDPRAIAYIGELDLGGSAVSLPVTNKAGLLQVSPTDGLTSLTAAPPGRPRAGPERYYPADSQSFLRLVPSDLEVADALLRLARRRGAGRIAVLHTEGFAERELAGILATRLRRSGRPPVDVERVRDDAGAPAAVVADIAEERPQAVLLSAVRGAAATALLGALADRLPDVPVLAAGGLAPPPPVGRAPRSASAVTGVLPATAQPRRGRRLLRSLGRRGAPARPELLYGYDAMRLVLDAIDSGGPDRRRVRRRALAPTARSGVSGRFQVSRSGAVAGRPLALLELADGRAGLRRTLP